MKVQVYFQATTKPSMIWLFNKSLKLQKSQDKIRKSQMVARVGKAAED